MKKWERRIIEELPIVAELLALSVAAGEGSVAALDRVVRRSRGELSRDLEGVLAAVRTGEPVSDAFDWMAAATGLPLVARFASGVAVAIERGTPLAAEEKARDARESARDVAGDIELGGLVERSEEGVAGPDAAALNAEVKRVLPRVAVDGETVTIESTRGNLLVVPR